MRVKTAVVAGLVASLLAASAPAAEPERIAESCSGDAPAEFRCDKAFAAQDDVRWLETTLPLGVFLVFVDSETGHWRLVCGVALGGGCLEDRQGELRAGQSVFLSVYAFGSGHWSAILHYA